MSVGLSKVKILESHWQNMSKNATSMASGFLVSSIFTLVTLYSQKIFPLELTMVVVVLFCVIFGAVIIKYIPYWLKSKHEIIEQLFSRVENGETLPSINELKKL